MSLHSIGASVCALSLSGAFLCLLVWGFDLFLGTRIDPGWRKAWWMLLLPAFLVPLPAMRGVWTSMPHSVFVVAEAASSLTHHDASKEIVPIAFGFPSSFPWVFLWLAGMVGYLVLILWRTATLSRHWSRKRLSTDSALLDLLETCKAESGITAPIGIVVSHEIETPALLGWLRPRILLPARMAARFTPDQLRSILFHELAHFKSLDIPFNWAFLVLRVVHWFNPLAHAAANRWVAAREEAADAMAIRWLRQASGEAYGEVLLLTLKNRGKAAVVVPFGALAIGETIGNLKRRIDMIRTYSSRRTTSWLGGGITVLLLALILVAPGRAQNDPDMAKKAAIGAIEPWLGEMDRGDYARSWQEASGLFKKAVASDKWVALSVGVRTPLGACRERKLASSTYQSGESSASGKAPVGTFVIVQFDTSFENMKYAVETVTFQQEADGAWRAAGYFIKPGS